MEFVSSRVVKVVRFVWRRWRTWRLYKFPDHEICISSIMVTTIRIAIPLVSVKIKNKIEKYLAYICLILSRSKPEFCQAEG